VILKSGFDGVKCMMLVGMCGGKLGANNVRNRTVVPAKNCANGITSRSVSLGIERNRGFLPSTPTPILTL
jgi:hypothetical protein